MVLSLKVWSLRSILSRREPCLPGSFSGLLSLWVHNVRTESRLCKLFTFYWPALIPPAKDVKKEESTSETFNTTKQVCTPPSIDHRSNHRLLQHKKRSSSHDANVKRTFLKTLSTADSKPQSSNNGNASHSTDSVEYDTN